MVDAGRTERCGGLPAAYDGTAVVFRFQKKSIPRYSRVVAIDDREDHLKAIAWGLSQAGFARCRSASMMVTFSPPEAPIAGIRIVFTDIHGSWEPGQPQDALRHHHPVPQQDCRLRPPCVDLLSMFPGDVQQMKDLIEADGPGIWV